MFYNNSSISKDEIHIIRSGFVESGTYSSRFWVTCPVHNNYTVPIRGKKDTFSLNQGPVPKNDKKSITKEIPSMLFPRYWLRILLIISP